MRRSWPTGGAVVPNKKKLKLMALYYKIQKHITTELLKL
jgi:hypothetical protein